MKYPRTTIPLTVLTAWLAAVLAVCTAGMAMAQPLSPGGMASGGTASGWAALSPGRAAGLLRARQAGGSVILMGVGAAASGGVALAMAVPRKQAGAQGAVINSTTGTTP